MTDNAVLVVEDNPVTRKLMRVALELAGYRVLEAEDGASALAAFSRERPNLVLQDLVLPDVDGLELVGSLRAQPGGDGIPILAVTGFSGRVDDPRFAGFNDLVVKPIEPSRMTDIVRGYLPLAAPRHDDAHHGRIVLLDDDPVQLKLQRTVLQNLGFVVEAASAADAALAAARAAPPDAFLSDVLMPETDGFTFCQRVRTDPVLRHVPVVLATARSPEPADVQLALRVGANALVHRTPDLQAAVAAIERGIETGPPAPVGADLSPISEDHRRRLLRQLERQLGVNQQLAQMCAMQGAILSSIAALSDTIGRRTNLDDALAEVLYALIDISGASRGAIFLRGADGGVTVGAALGFSDAQRASLPDFFGFRDVLLQAMRTSELVNLSARTASTPIEQRLLEGAGATVGLVVPFLARGEAVGAVFLGSNLEALQHQEWQAFARTVGMQLGQAIALSRVVEELTASEQRYRTLLEQANDAILVLTCDGRIVQVNEQTEALLGSARSLIVGTKLLEHIVPEHREQGAAYLAALQREGHGHSGRVGAVRGDGRPCLIELSGRAVDVSGERVIFTIARDITERERLELELRQAQKMEAVGQLTGGVAHDFNNLLTAILGYSELLLQEMPEGDRRRRDLEQVRQAGESAAALTRQLLAFSRQQVLQPELLAIDDVILKVTKLLNRVIGEHIDVRTDLKAPMPEVLADPGQLEQVVMNLAVNARDAMPGGGVLTIATDLVEVTDPGRDGEPADVPSGRYVVLSVTDTGCGMPEEVQSRIFEPFFTTKEVGKGTGMGLATVYGIVKQSGGHIAVGSRVGHGTTFRIYFPPTDAPPAAAAPEAIERAVESSAGRVLLVEDDGFVRQLAGHVLRASGFEVSDAPTPHHALRLAGDLGRVDLLLTDMVMPGMNGAELANRLKAERPAMKVLFMSGYAGGAGRDRLQPGEAFMEKPFTPRELVRRVKGLIG